MNPVLDPEHPWLYKRPDGVQMVHLPTLIAETFDVTRSEARRLIDQGAVKLWTDGNGR